MTVLTARKTMLYCPECSRTYEEGTQRFCSVEGARLLPAASRQTKGVFTNLLNQNLHGDHKDKKIGAPRSENPELEQPSRTASKPNAPRKIFEPVIKKDPPSETKKEQSGAPLPRLIKANEVPLSQAKLGDRKRNPTGRLALTWENTSILLGQTIKGRYYIVEKLSEDETSVAYLAEDKIVKTKKGVVRVLMNEKEEDFSSKIFAEERVSLSHINHPNIVHVLDSGELPEGKSFIVSEYIGGESLREKLRHSGPFNPMRTARIIRQAANALGEAHENAVLHRNLKPQHIILTVNSKGTEQVRVTDFAVFDGFDAQNEESIKYLSPEQIEGSLANFASDIYSLAVIAYQMLTGRMPFNFSNKKELLKAQKEGLSLSPSNLRLDLSPTVDDILEKALAYKPSERFPKARDFGDALYNALTTAAPWEKPEFKDLPKDEIIPIIAKEPETPLKEEEKVFSEPQPEVLEKPVDSIESKAQPEAESPVKESPVEEKTIPKKESPAENKELPKEETFKAERTTKIKSFKTTQELPWEKRSSEPPRQANTSRAFIYALGLLMLGIGAWAVWMYFSKRSVAPVYNPANSAEKIVANQSEQNAAVNNQNEKINAQQQVQSTPMDIESPPLPRKVNQPPNTEYFQNSRENLKGDLAKNFRGFTFYYPTDWTKNPPTTNFADVARYGVTGTPVEQFLVNYYESKGTFTSDADRFPKLVEQAGNDLTKALDGKFTLLSQGETKVNGDWRAYEMKFKGEGVTKNGEKIILWGRRLWIPAARPGTKTGFVITMLATSLSPEVKSADDVGVKGELASVLETFEPTPLDTAY
jgi:serine/threonine protein kinase